MSWPGSSSGRAPLGCGIAVVVAVVIIIGGFIYWAALTTVSTNPDEVALHYEAGPFSSKKYASFVGPGNKEWFGPGDKTYSYPFGQRSFKFSNDGSGDVDSGAISVVSSDKVTMTVSGTASFALNTDEDTLRQFHERIGLKYHAWNNGDGTTSDGWRKMLSVYFKDPLDKAMDAVSKQYDYTELYSDPEVKEEWENKVGALAVEFVNDQAAGDYFCQPSFNGQGDCGDISLTIQTPQPPSDIVASLNELQNAKVENQIQETRNTTQLTQSEGIVDAMNKLGLKGPEGLQAYSLYLAIQKGSIQILPVPQGSGITLPTAP